MRCHGRAGRVGDRGGIRAPAPPATPTSTNAPLPAAGDASGGGLVLLALAIVVAGPLVAIGLAVGLHGRRPGADRPGSVEPPAG